MPVRMSESDRVRGSLRAKVFIADIRYHDGLFCPYCQKSFTAIPHVDHVQSRKKGGETKEFDNLLTCCPSCNGRKCDTDVLVLFGSDIHYNVQEQLKNRSLTTADHQAAVDIFHSGASWAERIEMILDWVQLGMLPIRQEIDMSILDYQQVEAIANRGEFWILKNLDHLLRQHFAGDTTAAAFIELLYINVVLEVAA